MTEETQEVTEQNEVKPRGPHKKNQELEARIEALEADAENMKKVINAFRQVAHIAGWPKDIMENCGIEPLDIKKEKLSVSGRK